MSEGVPLFPTYWSLFEKDEVHEPPSKLIRFLHQEPPPAVWTQTLGLYAHGYDAAFDRLVMMAIEVWPRMDYLQFPIFLLARHSIELHLKKVIADVSAHNGTPADPVANHGLLALWDFAFAQLKKARAPIDLASTAECRKVVEHLHEADPDGQRFRYPHSLSGTAFQYNRVELEKFAKAYAHVIYWCEDAVDWLDG